jgi:dihydroflavonol-4-reductase
LNLVTGATGILGSHVVINLLLRSEPVTAARRKGSDLSKIRRLCGIYAKEEDRLFERINWIELDVTDYYAVEAALEGVHTVYHCAGLVSFAPADRRLLFRVNQEGTANVVNACLHLGNIALCHVSTIGTISNSDARVLDENVFWKKSGYESDYAISKYNGEREVWRGVEEGLSAVIVNPGILISPVFWEQSSGAIFRRCYRGNRFYTSGSSAYISARDAAMAMITLTQARKFGNRYILAEGNYTFKSVLSQIQVSFGRRPPFISMSRWGLRLLAALERILGIFRKNGPLLTKSVVEAAFNRQIYSNSKVRSALGHDFKPITEVIRETCVHYQTVSAKP